MVQKKQTLLSITVAFTVMVLIVGVTTLPAYSQSSESSKAIISIHCHINDSNVFSGATADITFVTSEGPIFTGINCNDSPKNNNKVMKFEPNTIEAISIETIIKMNDGSSETDCSDSSSGKQINTKCALDKKNYVTLKVNLVK